MQTPNWVLHFEEVGLEMLAAENKMEQSPFHDLETEETEVEDYTMRLVGMQVDMIVDKTVSLSLYPHKAPTLNAAFAPIS
jgi:hypothetical protein